MKKDQVKPRRLDQMLSSFGISSRRDSKSFLKNNEVCLSGKITTDGSKKGHPREVTVNGEPLDHPEGIYIVLHKPADHVCSHDPREGDRVYDLLPPQWLDRDPQVSCVGRLDKDVTGVLILSDDGTFLHKLTSPRYHVPRTYVAEVEGELRPEFIDWFAEGIYLEGETKQCQPAKLTILSPNKAELIVTEGKYHQVKRMFATVGCPVLKLHRPLYGTLTVDDLAPGEWRDLTTDEIENLQTPNSSER